MKLQHLNAELDTSYLLQLVESDIVHVLCVTRIEDGLKSEEATPLGGSQCRASTIVDRKYHGRNITALRIHSEIMGTGHIGSRPCVQPVRGPEDKHQK